MSHRHNVYYLAEDLWRGQEVIDNSSTIICHLCLKQAFNYECKNVQPEKSHKRFKQRIFYSPHFARSVRIQFLVIGKYLPGYIAKSREGIYPFCSARIAFFSNDLLIVDGAAHTFDTVSKLFRKRNMENFKAHVEKYIVSK